MDGLYGVNEARLRCLIVWDQTGDLLTFIYLITFITLTARNFI